MQAEKPGRFLLIPAGKVQCLKYQLFLKLVHQ